MGVALVALFIALGGTGYAASRIVIRSAHRATLARDRSSGRLARKRVQGPRGDTGPRGLRGPKGQTGPQGPQGLQGAQGQTGLAGTAGQTGAQGPQGVPGTTGQTGTQGPQGVPGTARAYAFVEPEPPCGTPSCTQTTPLRRILNVSLGSNLPGAPAGTHCFVLEGGIDSSTATVVVSVEGAPSTNALDIAQWVAGAPDCSSPEQIEVQTSRYKDEGTGLILEHTEYIPFSFVVP
jgi:Collagen triple helix repeat (20 copies)